MSVVPGFEIIPRGTNIGHRSGTGNHSRFIDDVSCKAFSLQRATGLVRAATHLGLRSRVVCLFQDLFVTRLDYT